MIVSLGRSTSLTRLVGHIGGRKSGMKSLLTSGSIGRIERSIICEMMAKNAMGINRVELIVKNQGTHYSTRSMSKF